MKKIFTLVAASLLTLATFAADRRPTVTVEGNRNYEIVIDGKSYFSNTNRDISISNLREGRHTIAVYKITNTGLFRKSKKMVSASAFTVRNKDISIAVDYFGKIRVTELKNNMKFMDNDGRWNQPEQEMERHDRDDRINKDRRF
jgi:hypothetical protein